MKRMLERRNTMKIVADTHAHTLASGHAYSTIHEMAKAAYAKGLKAQALTEHAPEMPGTCHSYYFMNLDKVPRQMDGVELLLGTELNIMDPQGTVDLSEEVCNKLDIVIASIHPPCYGLNHTKEENTKAYIEVMKKPYVNIIGHPDDNRFPIDYEKLVQAAKETHTLLEVNNSSLSPITFRQGARTNVLEMLDLCKQYEVMITTGSDAHVDVDAGNFTYVEEVLAYCAFPEELVATTDLQKLKSFLNIGK